MTIEEYHQRAAELGINRGALSAGFACELPGVATIGRQPHVFFDNKGDIVKPPAPDLTYLNPPQHFSHKKEGRTKKKGRTDQGDRGRVRAA